MTMTMTMKTVPITTPTTSKADTYNTYNTYNAYDTSDNNDANDVKRLRARLVTTYSSQEQYRRVSVPQIMETD